MFSSSCPNYSRMKISGVTLGEYVFPVNSSTYDIYPARTTQSYRAINNFEPTIDQVYNKIEIKLNWNIMDSMMWSDLLPYARKNVDGTSDILYFWDGGIGRFSASTIKVTSLKARAIAGFNPIHRHNIEFVIKQV